MSVKCHVRVNKDKILNLWEQLSREKFHSSSDKSRTAVRNHLPELTDALCDVIETGIFEKPKELGEIHGRQRFSFGDYTLSEVLNEYWLLKNVIFEELESAHEVLLKDFKLINRFFESAATVAAVEFSELRENDLGKATKHLESSYEDMERFVAVAAHDLRSPALTIIGYTDLLLDHLSQTSDEIVLPIQTIRNIGSRMIQLVDQLLDYSKISKSDIEKKFFPLSKSAMDAKSNLEKNISESNAEVVINDLPEINGCPILLTQLFQNLIANSLKFKSNSRPCEITISSIQDKNFIKIFIKDNGMGFDPTLNREIFEPFKRGNNIKNINGSGLGLATVQKIVELHGGKISAIGHKGEGAEFIIELPKNAYY